MFADVRWVGFLPPEEVNGTQPFPLVSFSLVLVLAYGFECVFKLEWKKPLYHENAKLEIVSGILF